MTKCRRCGTGRNDTPGPASISPPATRCPVTLPQHVAGPLGLGPLLEGDDHPIAVRPPAG